ncbi:MAG TPA: hypothetical protein VFU63_10145 [Ktedonobacterales bacterium]|nr:hypothetical protein [Ktedonobacterales bacterium]
MNGQKGALSPQQARALQLAAETDRQDVLAIVTMRFGPVPPEVREQIEACSDLDTLERLVLVAANVPSWQVFLDELAAGSADFKLVGARFEPLPTSPTPSRHEGETPGGSSPQPTTKLIQIQRPKER